MRQFARRFVAVLLFLLALTGVGTVGYVLIEGVSFGDALDMAAITLTTVGFQEVFPLSPAGRGFTMFLLVGGFAWMGIWFAVITSLIVELDLAHVFRRRRVMKAISEMSGHVIVCGVGRSGRQVAEELTEMGQPFVVIEQDPAEVERFYESDPTAMVIVGNATADHTLQEAGISRACGRRVESCGPDVVGCSDPLGDRPLGDCGPKDGSQRRGRIRLQPGRGHLPGGGRSGCRPGKARSGGPATGNVS